MLSPKVNVILALVIAFLVYLASVAINPYSLYQTEFSFIPSITNWEGIAEDVVIKAEKF